MTILNVGTYPPKQCGIATFSMDLCNSLIINKHAVQILAVSDGTFRYKYPPEVVMNINQNREADYVKAARFINHNKDIDAVVIQHEYGIYGGRDGEYILQLTGSVHKPVLVICHTVLPRPSKHQKQVLCSLCQHAGAIIAMTRNSATLLANLYEAPAEFISIIAHGVPEFKKQDSDVLKRKHHLEDRLIVSTFGLIGPGKGLEIGIRAIARAVQSHPRITYLILGQTHPMLRNSQGENYRNMLEALVAELGLEDNVLFVNKYLSNNELGEYLYLTDVYLSPYPNRDQAVSGTMAFALGCGRAIVSTPYAYACEMLNGGRGLLSRGTQPEEIASLITQIFNDDNLKRNLQEKARELGETWFWPQIGRQYSKVFANLHSLAEELVTG